MYEDSESFQILEILRDSFLRDSNQGKISPGASLVICVLCGQRRRAVGKRRGKRLIKVLRTPHFYIYFSVPFKFVTYLDC